MFAVGEEPPRIAINKNPEATKYPGHYLRPFNIVYMSVRLLHALCRGERGVSSCGVS